MPKLRKMLTDVSASYIQSLMRLIETQSTKTIAGWCAGYAEARPAAALAALRDYLAGGIKLPEAKRQIAECRNAAREAEGAPIAQAAARTIGAAASAAHNPAGSISLALYGALAIAYDRLGTDAPWEALESFAAGECARMESALRAVAADSEPNPAKINWNC